MKETASSMEQLIRTAKQNADNAWEANELTSNAQQVAIKGRISDSDNEVEIGNKLVGQAGRSARWTK